MKQLKGRGLHSEGHLTAVFGFKRVSKQDRSEEIEREFAVSSFFNGPNMKTLTKKGKSAEFDALTHSDL